MSKTFQLKLTSKKSPWGLLSGSKKIIKKPIPTPPFDIVKKSFAHSTETSDSFIVDDDDIEEVDRNHEGHRLNREGRRRNKVQESASGDSEFDPEQESNSSSDLSITSSAIRDENSSDGDSIELRRRKERKRREEKNRKEGGQTQSSLSTQQQQQKKINNIGKATQEEAGSESLSSAQLSNISSSKEIQKERGFRKAETRTVGKSGREKKYDRNRIFLQSLKNLTTYITNMLDFAFVSLIDKNFASTNKVVAFHKYFLYEKIKSHYAEKEKIRNENDVLNHLLTQAFEPSTVIEYARKIFDKEIADGKISMNDLKREYSFPKGKIDYFDPDFFGKIRGEVTEGKIKFIMELEAFKDKIYLKVIFCLIKKLIRFMRLFDIIFSALFANCGRSFYYDVNLDFLYNLDQFKNSGLKILTKSKRTVEISESVTFHLTYKEVRGMRPEPFAWNK